MKKPEIVICAAGDQQRGVSVLHHIETPDQIGNFFLDMVRLTCNGTEPDGYDNNGATRWKPLAPVQVIDRAATLTTLAVEALAKNDWVLRFPSHAELEAAEPKRQAGFGR